MVRNLVKFSALPFMVGILLLGFTSEKELDFSKYSTKGLDLNYSVQSEAEFQAEIPEYFPFPYAGMSLTGFKEALAFKESRGDYLTINRFGYLGKYQFGASTLSLLGIRDTNTFLHSPELQERAFNLNASRNKWVLRRDIKRFSGKWVGGIKITESGILAAAHLAGPGSVKKFLRSGGTEGFQDAFGTSIESYLKKFSGFDVSFIKANKRPKI